MSHHKFFDSYSSWVEISKSAIQHNFRTFKDICSPSSQVGVVLKGNAYGHGLDQIFPLIQQSASCIYVMTTDEAIQIRSIESFNKQSKSRILVIGGVNHQEVLTCAKNDIEVTISYPEWRSFIPLLKKHHLELKVHIHLDSGLSREGFTSANLTKTLEGLKSYSSTIKVVGLMSHFANTEDVTEQSYAHFQLEQFKTLSNKVKKKLKLKSDIEYHISASAASLVIPEARLSICRIGIGLYGFWPSSEAKISAKIVLGSLPKLKPALTWKCQSQIVKKLKKGDYVGYGCTYRCNQDTRIAVFPVGYYDGYPRLATGKAHVLINQKRCPIIGRIMMNHIIVDVTHATSNNSRVKATLLGQDKNENISAELLGTWAQTIHYEIVTRIGSHLRRIVTN